MRINGNANTGRVYLDGVELIPEKCQEYLNLSPEGFAWGDTGSGSAQLAFAILFEHYGAPISAIEQYEDFQRKYITPLPMDKDFEIEIHAWKPSSLN